MLAGRFSRISREKLDGSYYPGGIDGFGGVCHLNTSLQPVLDIPRPKRCSQRFTLPINSPVRDSAHLIMSSTLHLDIYNGPSSSASASTSHQYASPAIQPDVNKRKEMEDDDDSSDGKKRKHKFTRSRTACHQVRVPN